MATSPHPHITSEITLAPGPGLGRNRGMSDNPAETSWVRIGAEGVDVAAVVEGIRGRVERKRAEGVYDDPLVARAERTNLAQLRQGEEFVGIYLRCLRDAVFVDISDFEIRERRARLAPLLVRLKKVIWSLLKFYTYRLWSQQNEVNGLLVTAVQGVEEQHARKIEALEARVAALEARLAEHEPG